MLPAGSSWPPTGRAAAHRVLRLRRGLSSWALLRDGAPALAAAYRAGDVEIEGELAELMRACLVGKPTLGRRAFGYLQRSGFSGSRARQQSSAQGDLLDDASSDDARAYWLGSDLTDSCASDPLSAPSLSHAHAEAFDHIAKRLALSPGDHVLDVDGGFGALALHLARHYGVLVRTFISCPTRAARLRHRLVALGLDDCVDVLEDDVRRVVPEYAACVAIGAPDRRRLPDYEAMAIAIRRGLKPGGTALIHAATRMRPQGTETWIERAIFGAEPLPGLADVLSAFRASSTERCFMTSRTHDYAKTLNAWLERLDKSADSLEQQFGPERLRAWRWYLCGARAAFEVGACGLMEIVLRRPLHMRRDLA